MAALIVVGEVGDASSTLVGIPRIIVKGCLDSIGYFINNLDEIGRVYHPYLHCAGRARSSLYSSGGSARQATWSDIKDSFIHKGRRCDARGLREVS